jgi:hypothetical protein
VYDPRDDKYRSNNKYSRTTDFGGHILRRFEEHRNQKDWRSFGHIVVPHVPDLESTDPSIRLVRVRDHQRTYIKSMAGNVIYWRDEEQDVTVLGLMNIDSNVEDAIDEDKYRALQHYLLPVFRLMASRLLLIKRCPSLLHPVMEGR